MKWLIQKLKRLTNESRKHADLAAANAEKLDALQKEILHNAGLE